MTNYVNGTVAPGFESLRTLFESNLSQSRDHNAQLCVYLGEECVVDLWASVNSDENFSADSLVNVFSSGKSLESILLAMLADRGLLDFNARVTKYWPAFQGSDENPNKCAMTVADVMRHEAGLAKLDHSFAPEDLQAPALHENAVGKVLENHALRFPEQDSPRQYHAITRGWIANEIFRRVEPNGRTMGEFLRQEVSGPLNADVHIGLTDEELTRVIPIKPRGFVAQLFDGLMPGTFARKVGLTYLEMLKRFWLFRSEIRISKANARALPINGMVELGTEIFDNPVVSKGETPSAGAKCSARGLAKLAAAMANGGSIQGHTVLGSEGYEQLHANTIKRKMLFIDSRFTQAGLAFFDETDATKGRLDAGINLGRGGFYGWMGYGGSVFQWHPDQRIGFAYVPTSLNTLDFFNERGKSYQREVARCAAALAS